MSKLFLNQWLKILLHVIVSHFDQTSTTKKQRFYQKSVAKLKTSVNT